MPPQFIGMIEMSKHFLSEILNKLLFEKKIRPMDLAREVCVPQPTIHRLITGKCKNPHQSTLLPIANYFNMTVEQLKGENTTYLALTKKNDHTEIPLIDWLELHNRQDKTATFKNKITICNASEHCFSTRMNDSSMEPVFPKDCILIFDPNKQVVDRNYVLVKSNQTKNFVFRQILIDGEDKFLKTLHPELNRIKFLTESDQIIANLIEARHVYV